MNMMKYSKIFSICLVLLFVAGCTINTDKNVVNTNSGVVIHSDDYIRTDKNKTVVNGRLIKFESNYDDFSTEFDIHKM